MGREHKDFKKEGKLGQRVCALKRGRDTGIPLRTMINEINIGDVPHRIICITESVQQTRQKKRTG